MCFAVCNHKITFLLISSKKERNQTLHETQHLLFSHWRMLTPTSTISIHQCRLTRHWTFDLIAVPTSGDCDLVIDKMLIADPNSPSWQRIICLLLWLISKLINQLACTTLIGHDCNSASNNCVLLFKFIFLSFSCPPRLSCYYTGSN